MKYMENKSRNIQALGKVNLEWRSKFTFRFTEIVNTRKFKLREVRKILKFRYILLENFTYNSQKTLTVEPKEAELSFFLKIACAFIFWLSKLLHKSLEYLFLTHSFSMHPFSTP